MKIENFININLNKIFSIIYENRYFGPYVNTKHNFGVVPINVIDFKFVFVVQNKIDKITLMKSQFLFIK